MKKKWYNRIPLRFVFILTEFFCFLYIGWRLFFTIPFQAGNLAIFLASLLLIVEILGILESIMNFNLISDVTDYPVPKIPQELYPEVDVFIATYNEDPSLLYKTVNGCLQMEYPDPSKVHIYLCDDGRRESVRKLAEYMKVGYFRRETNEGAKAGNLNHALEHSNSPYIVTFDADMIPRRNFLLHTIPYFIDAQVKNQGLPKEEQIHLAFVQTPQTFYNPDLFQKNLYAESRIPNEQDYFYREIEAAKTRDNSVIYGGSNTVLSRQALEDVGGFFTKAITEDFATGLLMQQKGYVTLGISEPLASGLSPEDFPSLVQQRVRWGRGVVNILRQIPLFQSKELNGEQKNNYWTSIWYWFNPVKRFIFILMPILASVFGIPIVNATLLQILVFWVPMHFSTYYAFKRLSGNVRSAKWSNLYETILFPFLMFPILLETVGISEKHFKVTKKNSAESEKLSFTYYLPFVILLAFSLLGIVLSFREMVFDHLLGGAVTFYWLIYNSFMLILALFFLYGRHQNDRKDLRALQLETRLALNGELITGVTSGISDREIELELDEPVYLDAEQSYALLLRDREHPEDYAKTAVLIRPDYVYEKQGKWRYRFQIRYYDSYNDYLRLLYDRPVGMSVSGSGEGFLRNIRINLAYHLTAHSRRPRPYPVVRVNRKLNAYTGDETIPVTIKDFDYREVVLKGSVLPERLKLNFTLGEKVLALDLKKKRSISNGTAVYTITNAEALFHDPKDAREVCQALKGLHQKIAWT